MALGSAPGKKGEGWPEHRMGNGGGEPWLLARHWHSLQTEVGQGWPKVSSMRPIRLHPSSLGETRQGALGHIDQPGFFSPMSWYESGPGREVRAGLCPWRTSCSQCCD